MKTKKPRVSARGGSWGDAPAAGELAASCAELRGPLRYAVFAAGGLDLVARYDLAEHGERDALYAAHALGGDQAVRDLLASLEEK